MLTQVLSRLACSDCCRTLILFCTVFELALKHSLGKLNLESPMGDLLPKLRESYRLSALPLTEDDCLQLMKIPMLDRDPFDRMLVCQAVAQGLTIVTPDSQLQAYPVRTLW